MTDIGHNGGPALDAGRRGWVAVSREMREHWLVGFGHPVAPADPSKDWVLSRAEAWIDLIMECRYEAGHVMNGGQKMRVEPGQLIGAVSYLAARWNWTPKTVRGFLDKLEDDHMIEREHPGTECGKQKGKQSSVITVCNYTEYQVVQKQQGQAPGQAGGMQGASRGQAEGNNNKDNKGTKEQGNNTPHPPKGGRRRGEFSAAEIAASDRALASWNRVADQLGFAVVRSFTPARRRRLCQRLDDIGGLPNFDLALSAIPSVDFLMGRIPPKPGQQPFKLDIERLMQTDGNLGDVLAKLIDKALQAPQPATGGAMWWQDAEKVAAVTDDQWREMITQFAHETWPPDKLGPAPGSKRCVVPKHIIAELRLTEKYDANGISKHPH